MKVTAENIEALIVDYIDGALSKEIAAEVDRFVELNPEYAQMLSDYAQMCGVSVDVSKNEALDSGVKNNLKHTSDFDDLSVPYFNRLAVLVTENIAQPHESAEFENMLLESDDNIRSAALFSKCKIQDNNDIHYPFKEQLKRNAKVRSLWYYATSVAAILFALLAIKPLINNEILINTMAMSGRVEVDNRLVADINIDVLIPVSSHIGAQPSNSPIELQTVATIDEPIVFDTLDIARSKIDYAELTVDADSMSFVAVDYAQIDDDEFEIDADNNTFIGERGVSEIRRLSGWFHRRNKERNNPKICFSYDDEGKKDGMSLLIGGREVRVWSR
ncbi:MAG: hypothetical protein PUC50_13730 [Bacteroidales bacterium]|nr:hypothetical protein [Bacteroidales bacterium]